MDKQSLEGTLRQYITGSMNKMFTAIPAIITSVADMGEQRIDVRILIDKVNPAGETESHPIILNVPLMFPSSRSSMFSFPVERGDNVMLVFSQRSMDRLKMSSGSTNMPPKNYRKYSRNDAVAVPGFFPFSEARNHPSKRRWSHSTGDMVMTHNIGTAQEAEVRIKPSGEIVVNTRGSVTINCTDATINSDNTTINGDTNINGRVAIAGSSLTHNGKNVGATHTHGGVDTGSGNTKAPN